MKKLLGLALLAMSFQALAEDTILTCRVFPPFDDIPKSFEGMEMTYTIMDSGRRIKIGDNVTRDLTSTATSYEWGSRQTIEGQDTVMTESISRVTGTYQMYLSVDGKAKLMARGTCKKAEVKF
jgi:hypothetical protein